MLLLQEEQSRDYEGRHHRMVAMGTKSWMQMHDYITTIH